MRTMPSGTRDLPTTQKPDRLWLNDNNLWNEPGLQRLLERGTHRWDIQRRLTRYCREQRLPLPLEQILQCYLLESRRSYWKIELAQGPLALLPSAFGPIDCRRVVFMECHGDDLYLRAAVFLRRLIGRIDEAWWLTMMNDPYGVRDAVQDEKYRCRLRSDEARRGAEELGVQKDRITTGICYWPLRQGRFTTDGRLLSYESSWSEPTSSDISCLIRYLSDRKPDCVVTHPSIDNHPHHNFAGHTLFTALVHCIEQGSVRPDIQVLFVGVSREHGYDGTSGLLSLHTEEEAFAKAEDFTRIYGTQAIRRPGQYEHEIRIRDAASAARGGVLWPESKACWYGEEIVQARLVRAVADDRSAIKIVDPEHNIPFARETFR
jgi:hypothetical protein